MNTYYEVSAETGFTGSNNLADTKVFNNQERLRIYEIIKNKKTSKVFESLIKHEKMLWFSPAAERKDGLPD